MVRPFGSEVQVPSTDEAEIRADQDRKTRGIVSADIMHYADLDCANGNLELVPGEEVAAQIALEGR